MGTGRFQQWRLLWLWLAGWASVVQGQSGGEAGLLFREGSWAQLRQEASAEGKLVFADVYTTWCGPCREMERRVFPLAETGQTYNPYFLSTQWDAERGEGQALARRYQVEAYPTYLFIDPQTEEVVWRSVGACSAEVFLQHAQRAREEAAGGQTLSVYARQYANGNRDSLFLVNYLHKGAQLEQDVSEVLEAFLAQRTAEELRNPELVQLVGKAIYRLGGKAEEVLLPEMELQGLTVKKYQEAVRERSRGLDRALRHSMQEAIATRDTGLLQEVLRVSRLTTSRWQQEQEERKLRLTYAMGAGDTVILRKVAVSWAPELLKPTAAELARDDSIRHQRMMFSLAAVRKDTSSALYQEAKLDLHPATDDIVDNLAVLANAYAYWEMSGPALREASLWAEHAWNLYPQARTAEALAGVSYRLGDKKKAQTVLKQALELQNLAHADVERLAELLRDLEAGQFSFHKRL